MPRRRSRPAAWPGRIATDAPITAHVTADLASLKPLQPWVGTLAVMDGRAHVDVTARGTLAQPSLAGTLTRRRAALRSAAVRRASEGRPLARAARRPRDACSTNSRSWAARDGSPRKGRSHGPPTRLRSPLGAARVEWQAEDFTIVNRPDLRLVGDGKGTLALEGRKLALAGSINIDQGRVDYAPTKVGTLSDDVVIVGQPRKVSAECGVRDLPLDARSRSHARTRLPLHRRRPRHAPCRPRARHDDCRPARSTPKGRSARSRAPTTCSASGWSSTAASLLFDGPVDNPALDVVALRKNIAVEAGVELTGTVKVPRVRLVSNPPVPDGEKLSWLLTGQGLDRANRADLARCPPRPRRCSARARNRSRRRSPTRSAWTTFRCAKRASSIGDRHARARWSRSASAFPTGCRSCTSKG